MLSKNKKIIHTKKKGQTSIEILAILGVLVVGGIILGSFYLQNINQKTSEATEIANIDYNDIVDDTNIPLPVCGNNISESPTEQCDGTDWGIFAGKDCADYGKGTGNLLCTSCMIDYSGCSGSGSGSCGDNTVNTPSEKCDGGDPGDLGSYNCSAYDPLWFGTISCNNCLYDLTACRYCGDGVCTALDGEDSVSCPKDCVAAPLPNCGNSKINVGEECDLDNLNLQTCASLGYIGGDLTCIPPAAMDECQFDTSACHNCGDNKCDAAAGEDEKTCPIDCFAPKCGNGVIDNPPERCDVNGPVFFPSNLDCVILGGIIGVPYISGTLDCTDRCTIDTSRCKTSGLGSSCGDGICSIPEECVSCPVDCSPGGILNPGCSSVPNSMKINISPLSGTRLVNADFNIDVNTLETTPLSANFTLKVDVTKFNTSTFLYEPSSNCRYNGGAYASTIINTSGLSPSFTNYSPFNCNTAGTYKLKFTVTNDANTSDTAFKDTQWVINAPGTVATPVANPLSGTFQTVTQVTLTTATAGAEIWYTNNGVDPVACSSPSIQYLSPINIPLNSTRNIKAIACKAAMTQSGVMSETYIVTGTVATPTANPVGGTYTSAQSIVLSTTTPAAQIWYTLDNSTPIVNGASSYLYIAGSPIFISENTTIKAKAFKTDWTPSGLLANNYTITTDYCGDKTVPAYIADRYENCTPDADYLLASTSCSLDPSTLDVTYSGVTINDKYLLFEGMGIYRAGERFCQDHGFTFISATMSIDLSNNNWGCIQCGSGGTGTGYSWINTASGNFEYYTTITCDTTP